jgi:hypothetical protein
VALVLSDIVKRRSIRALCVTRVTDCALSLSGSGSRRQASGRNILITEYLVTDTWKVGNA